jgi:hypothetical protein
VSAPQIIAGVALALVAFFWWRWNVHRHPWKACLKCGGDGKRHTLGKAYGACSWCRGTSRRRRIGAVLWRLDKTTGQRKGRP